MKEYTTSRGVVIHFNGIASLLDILDGQFKPPDPPTYTRQSLAGVQTLPHDETTLEDPDGDPVKTAENRAAWSKYLESARQVRIEHEKALTRLCYLRGIQVDLPEDETWMAEHRLIGLTVPEDPSERKLYYISTEVVATVEDAKAVVLGVLEASGIPEEVLGQMADSFRYPMGESGRGSAGEPTDRGNGSGMVLQSPVRAGASSIPDGKIPKRVRRRKHSR